MTYQFNKKNKNIFLTLLKAFFTFLFFYIIFKKINLENFNQTFFNINFNFLAFAFIVLISQIFLASIRLYLIIESYNLKVNFKKIISLTFEGLFFNQILPTSIGGDTIRVWRLNQNKISFNSSILLVFLDRIIGLVVLIFIFLISSQFLYKDLINEIEFKYLNFSVISYSLIFIFTIFISLFLKFKKILINKINTFFKMINKIFNKKLYSMILVSISIHFLTFLCIYLVAISVSVSISFFLICVIFPLVIICTMIPISIGGWGLREGLMIYSFGFYGINSEESLILSILYGFLVVITSLPGFFIWFNSRLIQKNR